MNSLFLTTNDETNKIVFRVMDGKAVCYCSHPSVLFCKNCVQMTRNIVNSWDNTPENFFEKDDLIGQTLFHKSRSHLLEIFKVLRSMENKRLDSLLTQIMDLQKKDDFEDFGKAISQITKFDELNKVDDKDELDQVGKVNTGIDNNGNQEEQQKEDEEEEEEEGEEAYQNDNDEVFEDHDDGDEEFQDDDNHDFQEDEIIVLRPSTSTKKSSTSSTASKKHGNNKKNTPIKIDIIDGDNEIIENVDVKVNKKSSEPIPTKRNRKN